MTVHAAKGLEAPIVVLPDTCSAPSGRHDPKWLELVPERPDDPPLYLWATSKDDDSPPIREARLAAQAVAAGEHRRLLYVAMTRAAERLVIAGCEGARARPEDCWYNLIRLGLDSVARAEPAPWNPEETVWRLGRGAPAAGDRAEGAPPTPAATPAWLRTPAPREFAPASLAPSRLGATAARANPERRARQEVGRLAHTLLQDLPDVPPEARLAAAERFLQQNGATLSPPRRQELAARALAVLALPDLAPLFASGSRAEVAITGTLPCPAARDVVFSGRVDRLAVTPEAIYLADFKTGADPNSASRTEYVRQLAFYGAALKPLYPNRALHAFLVWIEAGRLTRISAASLEQALADLTGAPL
jgi:ATP-dependent helicase/nuclease subunit A